VPGGFWVTFSTCEPHQRRSGRPADFDFTMMNIKVQAAQKGQQASTSSP
jgi:hypothetical protein